MDFSNVQSSFQMIDCIAQQIDIKSSFIALPQNEQLQSDVKIINGVSDITKLEDKNTLQANFTMELFFTAKETDGDKEFFVHLLLNGLFTYKKNDEQAFFKMLYLNGNSTLYSIARSYIMTLSSMSLTSGKVVLPMINFVELWKAIQKSSPSAEDENKQE